MPYFDGVAGRAYFRAWRVPAPRLAALVFLHGFGEHSGLYHRLGNALATSGSMAFHFRSSSCTARRTRSCR